MKLLQILGGEAFSAANVSSTYWRKINYQLGTNEYDEADTEWKDEDAGWKRTAITIQVPFHAPLKYQAHGFMKLHIYTITPLWLFCGKSLLMPEMISYFIMSCTNCAGQSSQ
jgi:hypothetical protein